MKNIILGFWFWVSNRNNEIAQRRLNQCMKCEFRKGNKCGSCGCFLQAKSRVVDEECPNGIWEIKNPDLA